jgi:hypothetical protein
MKSSSSLVEVPLSSKLREAFKLASLHLGGKANVDFHSLDNCVDEYNAILSRYGRPSLRDSKVLDIGFGARPFRLVWLYSLGVNAWGADLDKPLLNLSLKSVLEIAEQNGIERALKSMVRYCISDGRQWQDMASEVRRRGRTFRIPEDRLVVADAGDTGFWAKVGHVDFVYSEDVFEHIRPETIEIIVEKMATALRPNGLALVRPMVFTGICGGHHLEWFPHTITETIGRRTEPWEHLRQNRFPANTYLNRLCRQDYVDLFAKHFRILENETMKVGLGKRFMTSEIRDELSQFSDDELFSNSVRFVLEPK